MHTTVTKLSAISALLFTLAAPLDAVNANETSSFIQFNLPAGTLADALNSYAKQASVTLSFEAHSLQGLSSPKVTGSYTPAQMLSQLLAGTNLRAIPIAPNAWVIEAINQQSLTLDTVKVESKKAKVKQQVYKSSSSVSAVTRNDIERFRGTSVGDIFQGISGVLVSENRNSGGLDINIRGMQGQGRVPLTIDGSRQETTVYRGYSGVSSRSYIDPDLVGNMTIYKGPVMNANGTGATGGLVDVKTIRADDIVQTGELSGIRVRLSGIGNSSSAPDAGTYAGYYLPRNAYRSDCRFSVYCSDEYLMPDRFAPEHGMERPNITEFSSYALSAAVAKRLDWADFVFAVAKREQGNYYAGSNGPSPKVYLGKPEQLAWYTETPVFVDGASPFRAEERIPNTNFTSESWLFNSSFILPQEQSLELSYIRYDSDYGEMMPSQIKSFGQARQWLNSEVLNQTYTARYRWQPLDSDVLDLKVNLWHTDNHTILNTPGVGSIDIAYNTRRNDNYKRWGLDVTNSANFYQYGDIKLDVGLAIQQEDMHTDTPQQEGFYVGSRSGWKDEVSAFINANWQLNEKLSLELGTRYTKFSSKDNNALDINTDHPECVIDNTDNCKPIYFKNSHSGSAPVAVLNWQQTEQFSFYLRYAEALRMPSLFENTSGWSVSPALDIPLNPEHAKNKEIGLNYLDLNAFSSSAQLGIKLAYFDNYTEDYLTRTQPNAWEYRAKGLDFFRLRNVDSLSLKGWELNVNYDANSWFIELNGTKYNHIEICNVASYVRYYCTNWGLTQSYINNMIPPNWNANANLGFRLIDKKLEFGVRATIMGKRNSIPRYNAPVGFNAPVLWHSYKLFDLYSSYKFNEHFSLDFSVENITDRYYLDALSLGVVPAPGRTAKISATLQF